MHGVPTDAGVLAAFQFAIVFGTVLFFVFGGIAAVVLLSAQIVEWMEKRRDQASISLEEGRVVEQVKATGYFPPIEWPVNGVPR